MSDDVSGNVDVERPTGMDLRRDGRGIALFTGGAFFSVLLALALVSAEPLERVTGTGLLARLWAGSFGLLPGLLFCGGIAALGAREFLAGGRKELRRHVRGLAFTALGLSILLGAFSDTAGGFLGHHSSGAIARYVHVVPAALVGLVAFVLPIWLFWLKPVILEGVPVAALDPQAPAVVHPHRASSTPDFPVATPHPGARPHPGSGVDLGVSPAEAAALIPEDLPSWRAHPRKFISAETRPTPPSPYREDVRLRGKIPEGAKPFHPLHAQAPQPTPSLDPSPVPAVHERTADPEPKRSAVSARQDLALPPEKSEPAPALEMPASIGRREREEELEELRLALEELTLDDSPVAVPVEVAAEPVAPSESGPETEEVEAITPPRPSWEQSNLFAGEEEPVDAYGTPISVAAAARALEEADAEPVAAVESGPDDDEDEREGESERDVTLKPVAASRGRKKSPPKAPVEERSRSLADIGCHLLEHGRVAVSMLQKQYGMDFEEATSALDELQRMGLIGPYLGGQRRDILLTREEWLEKVSSL